MINHRILPSATKLKISFNIITNRVRSATVFRYESDSSTLKGLYSGVHALLRYGCYCRSRRLHSFAAAANTPVVSTPATGRSYAFLDNRESH